MARFSYTEVFELPTFVQLSPYVNYLADVTKSAMARRRAETPTSSRSSPKTHDFAGMVLQRGQRRYGTWFQRDITGNIVPFRNIVMYNDPMTAPTAACTYVLSSRTTRVSAAGRLGVRLTWFPC
jgi:hypothetical protein